MTLEPWQGGRRALLASGVVGIAGLLLTLVGGLVGDPRRALFGYLVAFVYWLGLAVAALILLGSVHAAHATWPVVTRRFLETIPLAIPLFVVLFIPILVGMKVIFPWVDPSALSKELQEHVAHRRPYLNVPFFVVRAAIYFAIWIVVAYFMRAWSVRQDAAGGLTLTRWQRRLGTGSLPFVGFAMTFAAFDWMMSLDQRFYSTIFGVYWFAGSFMGAFAVVIIAAALTRRDPVQFGAYLKPEHFHALGNYLLSFVAFWGYTAFSQFMLMWIANLPDEVPWYLVRIRGGWLWFGAFLVFFQFLVPFFLLLQRPVKRNPVPAAAISVWLLFVHWVDLYWVVMPRLDSSGPRVTLWDFFAFLGVGGVAVAFTIARMRGVVAIPVRDPYLEESLRYTPP